MRTDGTMVVRELFDLLLQATNMSPQKKMELTDGYSFADNEAIFVMEILCLTM